MEGGEHYNMEFLFFLEIIVSNKSHSMKRDMVWLYFRKIICHFTSRERKSVAKKLYGWVLEGIGSRR